MRLADYAAETFNSLPADTSLIDAALYGMLDEAVEAELAADTPKAPKAESTGDELGREVCSQLGC